MDENKKAKELVERYKFLDDLLLPMKKNSRRSKAVRPSVKMAIAQAQSHLDNDFFISEPINVFWRKVVLILK